MSSALANCPSCANPLPDRARFCPSCGSATPPALDVSTGQIVAAPRPAAPAEEGADHRERLQRALGEGLKIRRLLGRGGFAEVWAAFDVRLKREVAVKTLRYDLVLSDTLIQRFQREAEAVAKLRHPNIIPIYEVGEGAGIAYFVMPMIEGESLGEALEREGSFSVEEACRILRETAGALAAAHRAGIVHRDIKPDNIMLEGPERRPIVMDFGIAKATGGADAQLTGTGMAMGTPHYMSPEQASGQKDLDHRSDQYALALVGYRMLAGQPAFQADSMPTLIMKQIAEVPKPVIERRPDAPRELSDTLARALAKDPAARFQSMAEFAAAIPTFGAHAASPGASGRRRPTATELARFPGATLPSWKEPLVLLGALGLVLGLALYSLVRPASALQTAAKRGDALFVGRAFLTKQGATGSFDERMRLGHDDTAFVWLQRAFGRAGIDARSLEQPVWAWTLHWTRDRPGGDESWLVSVAPNGRVVRLTGAQHDTMPGAMLPADSALRVAEGFVRELGFDPTAMTRVQDSIVRRAKRTDHMFWWEDRQARLVGQQGDTATPRVRVYVAGDRVHSFRHTLELPKAYTATVRKGSGLRQGIIAAIVLVWVILVIAAIGLAVTRQRTDELQWKAAAILALLALGFTAVTFIQAELSDSNAELFSIVVGFAFIGFFMLCGLLFGAVGGESLANEVNRPALVGYQSLARLRLLGPEWAGSVARGFAVAGIILAIEHLVDLAVATTMWRTTSTHGVLDMLFPWTLPLGKIGGALTSSIVILFATHFITRFTKKPWLGILLPALAMSLMSVESSLRPWPLAVSGGAIVGVLAWTLWRYGFLAATVAFWVAQVLTASLPLLASGRDYLGPGLVCVASLVALAASAWLARRRSPGPAPA